MNPGESIRSYFARQMADFTDDLDQLSNMDKPMDETYSCYQLLRKISEKIQPIIQFLLRLEENKFTFSELVSSLVAEEVCLNHRDCEL